MEELTFEGCKGANGERGCYVCLYGPGDDGDRMLLDMDTVALLRICKEENSSGKRGESLARVLFKDGNYQSFIISNDSREDAIEAMRRLSFYSMKIMEGKSKNS